MTSACDFKLSLRLLKSLGEQRRLLPSVYWLQGPIRSSKAQIDSLRRQISLHPAKLKAVRSGTYQLKVSLGVDNRQPSASQADFTVLESERDQSRL